MNKMFKMVLHLQFRSKRHHLLRLLFTTFMTGFPIYIKQVQLYYVYTRNNKKLILVGPPPPKLSQLIPQSGLTPVI
jgi:hypothetical protein